MQSFCANGALLHPGPACAACRLLLEACGPLPQYHPSFLAALLLAGKPAAAAAILQRLATWLAALQAQQREAEVAASAEGSGATPPLSPGAPFGAVAEQAGAEGGGELPPPMFPGELASSMIRQGPLHGCVPVAFCAWACMQAGRQAFVLCICC